MKPKLQFLSERDIGLIHETSLRILADIGMKMPHEDARETFAKAGASVDGDGVVKIPHRLVEKALDSVPKRADVVLFGMDSKNDIRFVDNIPANVCMTMAVDVIDPYTGERRSATKGDLEALTWLADRSPVIRANGGLVTPQDVPGKYNDWYTWGTCIQNTTKHITGGMFGAKCVLDAIEMASIAVEGHDTFRKRPFISGWVLTLPALGIDFESLDAMIEMSRQGIPIILSSGPMIGASSPMNLGGSLAQAHAEILACMTLGQLINPGTPVVYTSFIRSLDMKYVTACMGSPESGMLRSAMAQIGRHFDLPVRMPGLLRDSKVLDAQAGFETALTGVLNIFNADLLDSMQLDSDLVVDYADLVFTPDCVGALQRVAQGIEVSEPLMNSCFDLIKEVGVQGSFLEKEHTLKNFKKELWHAKVMNRQNYRTWKKNGAKDVRQTAIERVRELLSERTGPLLPPATCKRIDAILPG